MNKQLSGVRADRGHSYKSLEEMACSVREFLGIAPDQEFDASDFFEFGDFRIDHRGGEIPVITGIDALPGLTEALTRYNPESGAIELLLSEDSYSMLCNGNPRGKYTVSHELGHAVLHTEALMRLAELNVPSRAAFHRGKADHPAYLDTEWQANAFGSALLMPAVGIFRLETKFAGKLSAYDVADHFRTSRESATYRLQVYQGHKGQLM